MSAADPSKMMTAFWGPCIEENRCIYLECHTFLYVKKNISLPSTTAGAINDLLPIDNGGNMDSYLILS